jgi:hypothetical protein
MVAKTETAEQAYAVLTVDKSETVDEVVFAESGDLQLLGARSLEGLNLQVDARGKRLIAAGPIVSAAAVPRRPPRPRLRRTLRRHRNRRHFRCLGRDSRQAARRPHRHKRSARPQAVGPGLPDHPYLTYREDMTGRSAACRVKAEKGCSLLLAPRPAALVLTTLFGISSLSLVESLPQAPAG